MEEVHEAKTTPFANLGKRLREAGTRLAERMRLVKPKSLPPLHLVDPKKVAQEKKSFMEAERETLLSSIGQMAETLGDPDTAHRLSGELDTYEDKICEFFAGIPEDGWRVEKEELIVATMGEMIRKYPETSDALRRIANMGLAIGFLTEASQNTSSRKAVWLPTGTGRWVVKRLTSDFPGGRGLLKILRDKSRVVKNARDEKQRSEVEKLFQDTISFLAALLAGSGEAAFKVPSQPAQGKSRPLPGGYLRVRVEGEKIFPIAGVGNFSGRVAEIAERGIYLLAKQLPHERLELSKRLDDETFRDLLIFWSLCHRGWKEETREAAREEKSEMMVSSGTLPNEAFFSASSPPGMTFVGFYSWTTNRGRENAKRYDDVEFVLERNEEGALRVADCHAEHKELFADCRDFALPGELKYPLRAMVKVLESRAAHASEVETTEAESLSGSSA